VVSGALFADAPWKQEIFEEPIIVSSRPISDSEIKQVKTTFVSAQPLEAVLKVLSDPEACGELYHNCKELKILEELGSDKQIVYIRNKGIWPIKDRAIVLTRQLKRNKDGSVLISLARTNHPKMSMETEDLVWMPKFAAEWRLKPNEQGTEIEYISHVEPGGDLSPSLVNRAVLKNPFKTAQNLYRILEKKR